MKNTSFYLTISMALFLFSSLPSFAGSSGTEAQVHAHQPIISHLKFKPKTVKKQGEIEAHARHAFIVSLVSYAVLAASWSLGLLIGTAAGVITIAVIGAMLAVLATTFGIQALLKIKKNGKRGKTLAILAILAPVIGAIVLFGIPILVACSVLGCAL